MAHAITPRYPFGHGLSYARLCEIAGEAALVVEFGDAIDPGINRRVRAWFLAIEGETIVGYALCRWDRAGEPDRSTVRYLAVRRAWRKRGIALALLHAAFGSMYRHGKRGAGLGVDATSYTGADRLYVRAGMQRAYETLRYQKAIRAA